MALIDCKKDSTVKLQPNFTMAEFYSKCPDYKNDLDVSYIDEELPRFLQFVRNYFTNKKYKIAIKITSSWRTKLCNFLNGGASKSMHLYGLAVDWKFIGEDAKKAHEEFIEHIQNDKYIKTNLNKYGINGIGLYDSYFHVDVRNDNLTIWGPKYKKKENTVVNLEDQDEYLGDKFKYIPFILGFIVIVIFIWKR